MFSPAKKPAQVNPIIINGQHIAQVTPAKLLGVTLSVGLKLNTHIVHIVGKANQRVFMMSAEEG